MPRLLDAEEIDRQLADLPGWTRDGDAVCRSYTFPVFAMVISAVDQIAIEAEQMRHHPDMDIRWRTLRLSLSTHSEGGVTQLDIELAHRIHRIATDLLGA